MRYEIWSTIINTDIHCLQDYEIGDAHESFYEEELVETFDELEDALNALENNPICNNYIFIHEDMDYVTFYETYICKHDSDEVSAWQCFAVRTTVDVANQYTKTFDTFEEAKAYVATL